ncbi:MAG: cache domain-containing protein, partial [Balneolaceae bacterium]|nr:cache domain-containing protein [Balneolaceae bacterium]
IDKPKIEGELATISGDITSELTSEIDTVLTVLKTPVPLYDDEEPNLFNHIEKFCSAGLNSIENLFFVKSNGQQHANKKTISNIPTPIIDISSRAYFQKAKNQRLLCTEGFRIDDTCFYLESIISYNTGKQIAALSVPIEPYVGEREEISDSLSVAAVTGRFHSIIKTVLPFGFGFAILDEAGEVLFHSDSNRNLQENFFEELDTPSELQAKMFGRSTGSMRVKYHDQSTLMYVAPINDWPLSLVTYYDMTLLSLKYLEVYALYVSIYLIIILALLLIFSLGFVIEHWNDLFSKKSAVPIMTMSSIAPKKRKAHRYHMIMIAFLVTVPLFGLVAYFEQPGLAILVSTFLIFLLYWITRYLLSNHSRPAFWVARIVELLLISTGMAVIISVEYQVGIGIPRTVFYLMLPATLLVAAIFGYLYHARDLFRSETSGSSYSSRLKNVSQQQSGTYISSYTANLFLACLAFSILLTYTIYRASYLQETEAIQKYELTQFSRSVISHEHEERTYFSGQHRGAGKPDVHLSELAEYRIDECKGIYWGSFALADLSGDTWRDSYLFYPNLYQVKTGSKISTAHIYNEFSEKQNDIWRYTDGRLLMQNEISECQQRSGQDFLSVDRASFTGPSGDYRVISLLLVILLIAGGYAMMKQIVQQLFVLRTPEKYQFKSKHFDDNLQSLITLLRQRKHLYIVTVPVQFREILKKFNTTHYEQISWKTLVAGNLGINPGNSTEHKPLVVTEFNMSADGDKTAALRLLKRAMRHTEVIIVSNFDPLDLLKRTKQREDDNARAEHDELADLLAAFETYYFPLTSDTIEQYQSEKQNQDLLVKEQNIYYELWNSLSTDEQYVLYDLTHDGLVNTRNLPIIHRLYKKGLISDGGNRYEAGNSSFISSLEIVNDRFSRFIDKLAETENLKKLEEEINATGTWHQYRTPLLVILTGILLFVFITQQETYGEVVSVLGSIAASLPLILRVMNSFFSGKGAAKVAS